MVKDLRAVELIIDWKIQPLPVGKNIIHLADNVPFAR
jgi:hypothetical protein